MEQEQKKQWHFAANQQIISIIAEKTRQLAQLDLVELKEQLRTKALLKERIKNQGLTALNILALNKFKQWMEQKRYSPATIKNYEGQLYQFFRFYKDKSYHEIGIDDIMHYNREIILKQNLSISYQNVLIGAIKLFYSILDQTGVVAGKIQRPFKEYRLPEVLSKEEVKLILNSTDNAKHKALLSIDIQMTIYSYFLAVGFEIIWNVFILVNDISI